MIPLLNNAKETLIIGDRSYAEVKVELVSQGWSSIKNLKIQDTSLYAQEVFNLGFVEVIDCISMERDSCLFRFRKNKQILEVKTFGRDLKVDSYRIINARKNN